MEDTCIENMDQIYNLTIKIVEILQTLKGLGLEQKPNFVGGGRVANSNIGQLQHILQKAKRAQTCL